MAERAAHRTFRPSADQTMVEGEPRLLQSSVYGSHNNNIRCDGTANVQLSRAKTRRINRRSCVLVLHHIDGPCAMQHLLRRRRVRELLDKPSERRLPDNALHRELRSGSFRMPCERDSHSPLPMLPT
jgi:hypothetical protein